MGESAGVRIVGHGYGDYSWVSNSWPKMAVTVADTAALIPDMGVYHDGYGSIMLAGCAGIPK